MPQSIERGQLRARSEKHQDGLTVPVADWEFIKSKIREIDVSTGLFSALGWAVIGVAGSCLVNYMTLDEKDKQAHVNLLWFFGVALSFGFLSLLFAWKTNKSAASKRDDALVEMDRIENRYEPGPSDAVLSEMIQKAAVDTIAKSNPLMVEILTVLRLADERSQSPEPSHLDATVGLRLAETLNKIRNAQLTPDELKPLLAYMKSGVLMLSNINAKHGGFDANKILLNEWISYFKGIPNAEKHVGDLNYNLALDTLRTNKNASEGWEALREACILNPLNGAEMAKDPDFAFLVDDPRFIEVTKSRSSSDPVALKSALPSPQLIEEVRPAPQAPKVSAPSSPTQREK